MDPMSGGRGGDPKTRLNPFILLLESKGGAGRERGAVVDGHGV